MKGYTIQHSIELLEKNQGGGSGGPTSADKVSFNNTGTDIVATNVQAALAELAGRLVFSETETLIGQFNGLPLYSKIAKVPADFTLGINGTWTNSGVAFTSDVNPVFYYLIASYGYGAIASNISGTNKELLFANVQKIGNITIAKDSLVILMYTKTPPTRSTRKKSSKQEE